MDSFVSTFKEDGTTSIFIQVTHEGRHEFFKSIATMIRHERINKERVRTIKNLFAMIVVDTQTSGGLTTRKHAFKKTADRNWSIDHNCSLEKKQN